MNTLIELLTLVADRLDAIEQAAKAEEDERADYLAKNPPVSSEKVRRDAEAAHMRQVEAGLKKHAPEKHEFFLHWGREEAKNAGTQAVNAHEGSKRKADNDLSYYLDPAREALATLRKEALLAQKVLSMGQGRSRLWADQDAAARLAAIDKAAADERAELEEIAAEQRTRNEKLERAKLLGIL